jgi:hypothetical protein
MYQVYLPNSCQRGFDSIKDINDGKELWKFAVRLEDMWKMDVGKGEHIEFLILDKQVCINLRPFHLKMERK